jgi:2-dehydropantoate 2-reductase
MRIAVVGSGGTGGYFGGLLARAGEEVTFIARGAHLEALRLRGLTVKSRLAGNFTLPVRATDTPSEVDPVDLILFCVKTYDTDTAAHTIRPLIGADTMLLSLQNGVDNAERIAKIAGHEAELGAVAYVVSAMEEPGVIAQTAGPGRIILGELAGGMSVRTEGTTAKRAAESGDLSRSSTRCQGRHLAEVPLYLRLQRRHSPYPNAHWGYLDRSGHS